MLLKIHPLNPSARQINKVVECLREGGVIIYPTDTIYGLGCDINKPKAVDRVAKIKGVRKDKTNFSFICYDLSHLAYYTRPVDNSTFKLMKSHFPGPYTFILNASNSVPKIFRSKKKTVGIRIPDNNIPRDIVRELGNPILTTSIRDEDELLEYTTDPELIYEKFKDIVDIVIDGGYGGNIASTIINCTSEEPVLIREGLGKLLIMNS
jgi:tRNA threonylcarbamoyl adenosine modification protein (Sua5/YciO/YrdC/YwlC family)